MTRTFGVDENNDLYIGPDGNLVILSGIEAIKAACASAAKAQRGEMVLEVDQGIPNFQAVWVGVPNIPQFEAALRQAIQNVDGVLRIISLNTITQNGTLFYEAEILTTEGQAAINGNITV